MRYFFIKFYFLYKKSILSKCSGVRTFTRVTVCVLWLQLFHLSQLLLLHIWRSARGKAFRLTLIPGDTRCCTLAEAKGIYFGHILNPFVWKALPNINVIISISCLCRIIYGWHDTLTFHHQPLLSFFFSFFLTAKKLTDPMIPFSYMIVRLNNLQVC